MRNFFSVFLLVFAGLSVSGVSFDSSAPIVIPENASPQERYASRQMADYLSQVCGKKFQIISEGKSVPAGAIYIGATRRAEQAKMNSFKPEEYRIRFIGKDAIIAGSVERGVLFGTYEFLERFAGVRFFSPECERIPKANAITVSDADEIYHKPTFLYRYIYGGPRQLNDDFARKLRITGWGSGPELGSSERFGFGDHCHTFCKYSLDFPEEISWMGSSGKRTVVKVPTSGSICFSHPEVLKRFAAKLKQGIARDRAKAVAEGISIPRFYSISQNDCDAACFCPQCQAFAAKHGNSGLVIDFVNRLYREIKSAYPDVYLVTFAYFDTLQPPKGGIQPDDHVLIQIATYTKKFHDHLRAVNDPANGEYLKLLNDWEKCAKERLAVWDYWRYYFSFLPPATNVMNLQEICRKYRDLKLHLLFIELENGPKELVSFCDLSIFLGARLLDDPDRDAEILISDFMKTYYGPAAGPMRKYLTLIDEGMKLDKNPMEQSPFWERKYLRDPNFYQQGFALLNEARKDVAGDALLLARVNAEMVILEAACLKTWDVHRNPLKWDKAAMQKDVEKILPSVMNHYFSSEVMQKYKMEDLVAYYSEKVEIVPAQKAGDCVPLSDFNPEGPGISLCEVDDIRGGGSRVTDAASPKGKTISISATISPAQAEAMHKTPFSFGLYEKTFQKYLLFGSISPDNIPQDEKYHWYCIGITRLYPELILWMHQSWGLSWDLGKCFNSAVPEQSYKVYVLLKFQGPGYVKGSKQSSDICLARAALVPCDNRK